MVAKASRWGPRPDAIQRAKENVLADAQRTMGVLPPVARFGAQAVASSRAAPRTLIIAAEIVLVGMRGDAHLCASTER